MKEIIKIRAEVNEMGLLNVQQLSTKFNKTDELVLPRLT
jgi:hypothetical protein